ncbi:uncharacterized protein KGF55_000593 [Candida pseudojiufengensis]|uniref:uncharacterized protein n=1 Tax=Candida pseudojiufengensis TaxID=497109 RepID=UPI0022245900|nr:uncharacterized protein KGF55_000593 [Candida pseudojiufengensis]KAI5966284.1 hypothetical protein KGF55_000593 [Candida pseudojiufengensis]
MLALRRLAQLKSSSLSWSRSIHASLSLRSDFAFVFDIDGVLIRGKKPIPQAKPALELLNKHKIPYILMTNGGGVSEAEKAKEVSSITGGPYISPLQVVQSHTPMKSLIHDPNYSRVLVVGGDKDNARKVAESYGFKDVVLPIDIVRSDKSISPHSMYKKEDLEKYSKKIDLSKPIDAILVFNDPRDLSTDMQIVQDLLNSKNGLIGTKRDFKTWKDHTSPSIPIIFSNNDYVYANDHPLPRFGQGAFRMITEKLYNTTNKLKPDQNLDSLILGKPFKLQYDFAHHILIDWNKKLESNEVNDDIQKLPKLGEIPETTPFKKIYMVGDNPESDIKGANDHGWESILLRTGVFQDEDYDSIIAKPTVGVFDNVEDAVKYVLNKNGIKI